MCITGQVWGLERVGMGKERVATIFSPCPLMIWSKRVEQLEEGGEGTEGIETSEEE